MVFPLTSSGHQLVPPLNQACLNAGKSTVGFVNPTLYANPSALNDVIVGGNRGCGTPSFSTAPGWASSRMEVLVFVLSNTLSLGSGCWSRNSEICAVAIRFHGITMRK